MNSTTLGWFNLLSVRTSSVPLEISEHLSGLKYIFNILKTNLKLLANHGDHILRLSEKRSGKIALEDRCLNLSSCEVRSSLISKSSLISRESMRIEERCWRFFHHMTFHKPLLLDQSALFQTVTGQSWGISCLSWIIMSAWIFSTHILPRFRIENCSLAIFSCLNWPSI